MTGRRYGLIGAAVFIGAEVAMAASFALTGIAGWHGVANAATTPIDPALCADPDGAVGECRWTVEIDGRESLVTACAYEDGNVDGLPCLWTDPDSGAVYYVGSDNYR